MEFGFWSFPCFVEGSTISRAREDVHTFQPYLLGLSEEALLACLSLHEFDEVRLCLCSELFLPDIFLGVLGCYRDLEGVTQFWTLHLYREGISCPFLGHHPFLLNFPSLLVCLAWVLQLLVRLWRFYTSRNSRKACQNVFALAAAVVKLSPETHTLPEAFRL